MDWKQFFASIIGSLAWPALVAFVLYIVRAQLQSIVAKIEELTLPGGMAIKLAKQIEEIRDQAEVVEAETGKEPPDAIVLDPKVLSLAREFPEAAVLQEFKELESILLQIRSKLPDDKQHRNISEVMKYLLDEKFISPNVFQLFQSLRQTRNAIAHVKSNNLTPASALELVRQARLLVELLREIHDRLPERPPPF